ncbi:hypothetical protein DMN91_009111 [Ooceraea biroi]|uniref:Uncharacterized protein n=1 Tax=Ooceraea biroi TaxID=2015173 RepID=A0A3L8DEC1_OOCBI|nr:hypothetical protein DMN91_009111 [Ooceraea biroi]
MLSGISLAIAILLALNCACRAMDHPSMAATATQEKEWALTSGRRVHRHAYENVTSDVVSVMTDVARDADEGELTFDSHEDDVEDADGAQSKIGVEERGNQKP